MGCRNPFSKQLGQISCLFGVEVTTDHPILSGVFYMRQINV